MIKESNLFLTYYDRLRVYIPRNVKYNTDIVRET